MAANTERRLHLERYVQAWLRTHALRVNDLGKAEVWDRLVRTLSADFETILGKSVDLVGNYLGRRVAEVATGAMKRGLSRLLGGDRG